MRSSLKHWSRWESLRLALMPDEAIRRRWPRRSPWQRVFGNPWSLCGIFVMLVLLVLSLVQFGRSAMDAWAGGAVFLGLILAATVPTRSRRVTRKLLELRRERLRVVSSLVRGTSPTVQEVEEAAVSVAQRREMAQARISNELGPFRGLFAVARLSPLTGRLCIVAWGLFWSRGIFLRRALPWVEGASLIAVAVLMIIIYFLTRERRALLRTAIPRSLCPDCGYPLGEVVPRFAVPEIARSLGPERCTECGSPWPLIPPDGLGQASTNRPSLSEAAQARAKHDAQHQGAIHEGPN